MVFGPYNFGMRRTIENYRNTMHNALNLDTFLKFFRSKLCGRRIRSVQTYTKPCVFPIIFSALAEYAQVFAGYAHPPDTLTLPPDTLTLPPDTLSSLAGYAQLLAGYAQSLAGYAQFSPDTLSCRIRSERMRRT